MRYKKYHWLTFVIFLLVICLIASAEKKGVDDVGLINISAQNKLDVKQQIVEDVENLSESGGGEPTLSVVRAGSGLNWQVISTGGNKSLSGNSILSGTIGQTATFISISGDHDLNHGFWQDFKMPCECEPGEADGISPINILDVVYLINYKYKYLPPPIPYPLCSGDPNVDCVVNILDIVYLINFKYKSGPPPGTCEEWTTACGWPLRN